MSSKVRARTPSRGGKARRSGLAVRRGHRSRWALLGAGAAGAILLLVAILTAGTGSKKGLAETAAVTVGGKSLPAYNAGARSGPDAAVGARAPELRGKDFSGNPVAIVPDGKAKIILFVAHWCPHCQREVPVVRDWLNSGGLPAGVEVEAVSTSVSPPWATTRRRPGSRMPGGR